MRETNLFTTWSEVLPDGEDSTEEQIAKAILRGWEDGRQAKGIAMSVKRVTGRSFTERQVIEIIEKEQTNG